VSLPCDAFSSRLPQQAGQAKSTHLGWSCWFQRGSAADGNGERTVQIRRCPAAVSIRPRRRQSERPPDHHRRRPSAGAEGLKRKTTAVLPGELARIRLIAAGGPNLQAGDLITAEPGFQAKEGRANGRRQQPDGGCHRLLGDRQQQNFDNVGGRPERDCDGVVISGHCSFRCSKRRFCGHTGSPPP
jgi:hypothetical protein